METLPVIEHFDELKDGRLGLLPCVERLVMHQLVLQRAEEALHDGVVITVPLLTETKRVRSCNSTFRGAWRVVAFVASSPSVSVVISILP